MIPKPDGTKRFCVDFRPVNAITVQDPYIIPRIDDIFERLNGSKLYTTIDLKSGYWQIYVDEDSIAITASRTADGLYEFLRIPFGLKCEPACFCRIMRTLFANMPFVEVYFDDILIH